MDYFDAYGEAARRLSKPTLISGRNSFQVEQEKHIVNDVFAKLLPSPSDRLLEIGCGVGVLLTPLAKLVKEAVGIDHPACIEKYVALGKPSNVRLIAGRWPEAGVDGQFDRILVYSVLHILPDADTARSFIRACLDALAPGGRLMLGDIPNEDSIRRFKNSEFGKKFHAEYLKRTASLQEDEKTSRQRDIFANVDRHTPHLTDDFMLDLLTVTRKNGCESYIVPQPQELQFAYTREDILICKRW